MCRPSYVVLKSNGMHRICSFLHLHLVIVSKSVQQDVQQDVHLEGPLFILTPYWSFYTILQLGMSFLPQTMVLLGPSFIVVYYHMSRLLHNYW